MRGARFQTRHLGDPWAPPWTLDHNTCTETTLFADKRCNLKGFLATYLLFILHELLKYTLVGLNNATATNFLAIVQKPPIDLLQQFLPADQIQ